MTDNNNDLRAFHAETVVEQEMAGIIHAPRPPFPSIPAAPDYKARFETMLYMIGEISNALGIPDDEASCANGNDLILSAIAKLRAPAPAAQEDADTDYKSCFTDACLDLAAIHTALGIPDDEAGGAEPILEAIAELQARQQSAAPADAASEVGADASSDEPDMFWNHDDSERCQDSIHNVVVEAYENGCNVGDIVEVQQAIRLHNIKVRIIQDPEDSEEIAYEAVEDAAMSNQAQKGGAE